MRISRAGDRAHSFTEAGRAAEGSHSAGWRLPLPFFSWPQLQLPPLAPARRCPPARLPPPAGSPRKSPRSGIRLGLGPPPRPQHLNYSSGCRGRRKGPAATDYAPSGGSLPCRGLRAGRGLDTIPGTPFPGSPLTRRCPARSAAHWPLCSAPPHPRPVGDVTAPELHVEPSRRRRCGEAAPTAGRGPGGQSAVHEPAACPAARDSGAVLWSFRKSTASRSGR